MVKRATKSLKIWPGEPREAKISSKYNENIVKISSKYKIIFKRCSTREQKTRYVSPGMPTLACAPCLPEAQKVTKLIFESCSPGMRTLCVAFRKLTREEFQVWSEKTKELALEKLKPKEDVETGTHSTIISWFFQPQIFSIKLFFAHRKIHWVLSSSGPAFHLYWRVHCHPYFVSN